jgi:hypothetical protein
MNVEQIMYIHLCKLKNDTCWNCSRNKRRGWWWKLVVDGVNSSMIYLMHCKKLCKSYNVPLPSIRIIKNFKKKRYIHAQDSLLSLFKLHKMFELYGFPWVTLQHTHWHELHTYSSGLHFSSQLENHGDKHFLRILLRGYHILATE